MEDKDWILQVKDTRRNFGNSAWIPLRQSIDEEKGNVKDIGYINEYFGCGSVAFPPEQKEKADGFDWNQVGISHSTAPHAYENGYYSPIEQYEYNDKEPMGVNLVFEYHQPVTGIREWILNPDLVIALGLIKDGNNWIRPAENFIVVARETINENGNHTLIEIKQEFLIDYLAARNLSLRLSYYRQRVANVINLEDSVYSDLTDTEELRDGGKFELLIRDLEDVFGGGWAKFRVWRTDIDEDEDAPVMGQENDENTDSESSHGSHQGSYKGVRVTGEFWRNEWIEHQNISVRVRGDKDQALPQFIVKTDGTRMTSHSLNNEDIGRWLWFRSNIVSELLSYQGFSLKWYTAETGGIHSTSGSRIHFGINASDLITVYAYDIARLSPWEQHVWAAQNLAPEGKVSPELLMSQVEAKPASTYAVEELLLRSMELLEAGFRDELDTELFSHKIDESEVKKYISRFSSHDEASLLKLAKELIRVFSERLNKSNLRQLATHKNKKDLGSNKLLEDILAQKVGTDRAHKAFTVIVGTYDMRLGDAHTTSSKIGDALKLAGIDKDESFLKQGEQLIRNFGEAIWWIGKLLFSEADTEETT